MQSETILPVILAGDTGQSLWPVSRDSLPAQFAQLVEGPTLFQQTVKRLADPQLFAPPLIVTTRRGVSLVSDQLAQLGCSSARIVCGPSGLGSAGAIALALEIAGNESGQSMMIVPAGHAINDTFAFRRAAGAASRLALRNACIVAIGIPPEHPETRCGYLRTGAPILGEPGLLLDSFVENPSAELAARLLRTPGTFWNSGVFLFDPEVARSEFRTHAPEVASQAAAAVAGGTRDGLVFRPDNSQFTGAGSLSFEQAVLARTARAAVTPGDPGWSDLATWKAVWERSPQDSNRNVISGQAYCVNTTNSMALTDGPVVGIAGLDDVVVVASRDAVLVTSRSETDDVDRLVDEMRADGVNAVLARSRETRQWGVIENLDRGDHHQVRRITLNSGESLPMQYHHHRSEHWVVVAGLATVTLEDHVMMLGAGQQVFIPLGATHRLENLSHETVELIEISYGHYIGEDDVVTAKSTMFPAGRKALHVASVA